MSAPRAPEYDQEKDQGKVALLEAEIDRLKQLLSDSLDAASSDRERFLHLLNDITFTALSTSSLDELLQLLADRLGELINADGAYITLWDEETQSVVPGAAYGPLRDVYKTEEVKPRPGEPTMTDTVLKTGKPIIVPDVRNSPHVSSRFAQIFPARSHLAIPLTNRGQKLGAAMISFNEPHDFTATEVSYCEQAVAHIALALANAISFEQLKKSIELQQSAQEALKRNEQHLLNAQSQARVGSGELFPAQGKYVLSEQMYRMFDIDPEKDTPGTADMIRDIDPDDRRRIFNAFEQVQLGQRVGELEFKTYPKTGPTRHYVASVQYNAATDPALNCISWTIQDVTDRVLLEEQLRHASKMEAVGRLAGGIAHDFNNILTVILGNQELLKVSLPQNSQEQEIVDQTIQAADRATSLTRQLLVVSRKQVLQPRLLNLNDLISEMGGVLAPLVGDHISINLQPDRQLGLVKADAGQMEQVLMNLVINARDEMADGGEITITTRNRSVTLDEAEIYKIEPGEYVQLSVADTGPGIDAQTRQLIFEPFFTTKESGKGTGLGLAIVYGIVEQSGGNISITSEPGEGAAFQILMPRMFDQPDEAVSSKSANQQPQGKETILVAEDHKGLRDLVYKILTRQGYTVLAAPDGPTALQIAGEYSGDIDLLLTDVQMPGGMSGGDLAEHFSTLRPNAPVLFMSGYTDNEIPDQRVVGSATNFMPKPFKPFELIKTIQSLLEG